MPRTKQRVRPGNVAVRNESSRSVAATVGWMLATLTTLAGILAVSGLQIASQYSSAGESLTMLSRLLLFASVISGLVSLVFLGVTFKVREDRPPLAIVVASVVISVVPLIALVVVLLNG